MNRIFIENVLATGTSFLTIVAPKFCCWSSAIAAISGGVSYLAWVYPMRPYLFGLSFVLVGFSFYQSYRPFTGKNVGDTGECQVCQTDKQLNLRSRYLTWLVATFIFATFITSYL